MTLKEFYKASGFPQPNWSRMVRAQNGMGYQDMRAACDALSMDLTIVTSEPERMLKLLELKENMVFIEPIGTKVGTKAVGEVVKISDLAFLIKRLS